MHNMFVFANIGEGQTGTPETIIPMQPRHLSARRSNIQKTWVQAGPLSPIQRSKCTGLAMRSIPKAKAPKPNPHGRMPPIRAKGKRVFPQYIRRSRIKSWGRGSGASVAARCASNLPHNRHANAEDYFAAGTAEQYSNHQTRPARISSKHWKSILYSGRPASLCRIWELIRTESKRPIQRCRWMGRSNESRTSAARSADLHQRQLDIHVAQRFRDFLGKIACQ